MTSPTRNPWTRALGTFAAVLALVAFSAVTSAPSHAAGGSSPPVTPKCKKGQVWDSNKKACVAAKKKSGLSDDDIYANGRMLAHAGRFDEAFQVLYLAANKNDPRILNYLGYASRKTGQPIKGLKYYHAAIKIDPDYTLARSYMGEAYLMLGDRNSAMVQLAEIAERCGTACDEYTALKARLDGKPATGW